MPKKSPSKTRCSRCGKTGHNKNNRKFHSLPNKESPSKYENCVMDVKEKQSKWCKENGYPINTKDPDGKSCAKPWAVCARLR